MADRQGCRLLMRSYFTAWLHVQLKQLKTRAKKLKVKALLDSVICRKCMTHWPFFSQSVIN